ncbi:hypothetical protein EVJ58_g5864, partial [Rhodofomes roseus]
MWFPAGFPITVLGLASQVPLEPLLETPQAAMSTAYTTDFAFKEGNSVFTPNDLVELVRPGTGLANPAGDLVLVPVSQYSRSDRKNTKSIHIASVESSIQPFEIPLTSSGEAFWLDSRTVGHAVAEGEDKDKVTTLYAISVKYEADSSGAPLSVPEAPVLVGKFPTSTASSFKYSAKAGVLVFSDYVHSDGVLENVKKHDEAWENRGDTAYVFDETFERHWDTWVGPKRSSLFSVTLSQSPDTTWVFGSEFVNLLKGTSHTCPVEPFGGTDDFDVSETHVVYTAKDPALPPSWHTKQNVYLVDINGADKPVELTSGKHGATHSPVLNKQGDKAAWLQLDKDGAEADRAQIVIYDLTEHFSEDGKAIYFTAGDIARIKVFALPVPPTPSESSADPSLPAAYREPIELTSSGAASGVQVLPNDRLLFTRSSLTSPNDV